MDQFMKTFNENNIRLNSKHLFSKKHRGPRVWDP